MKKKVRTSYREVAPSPEVLVHEGVLCNTGQTVMCSALYHYCSSVVGLTSSNPPALFLLRSLCAGYISFASKLLVLLVISAG